MDLGERGGSGRELEGMEGEETAVGMYFMRKKNLSFSAYLRYPGPVGFF